MNPGTIPDSHLRNAGNYTAAFGAALADAGIRTVLGNVRTPRMMVNEYRLVA